jgi:uncharacterized protein YciI
MHFFYKLNAPRPDFHLTMDENENSAMQEHMAYWAALFENNKVIVYGPVFDPSGVYGMAVIEVESEDQADLIKNNDPAVSSGVCSAEVFQMQVGMAKSN